MPVTSPDGKTKSTQQSLQTMLQNERSGNYYRKKSMLFNQILGNNDDTNFQESKTLNVIKTRKSATDNNQINNINKMEVIPEENNGETIHEYDKKEKNPKNIKRIDNNINNDDKQFKVYFKYLDENRN